LIAKYDVNNSAVHLDITPTATTKGFVDWGDGTVEALSDNVTHQYIGASKPTVKLWVDGGLDVANIAADNTLVEVVQWGDKVIKHPQVGSNKLVKVPTVAPLGLTSTVSTFEGATLFNQNLNGWDMSGVTSVEGMFAGASAFNGLIDAWNVSKVKRFTRMFSDAASFNRSINAWNVSAGESFANMFTNASTFNQPIDQWRPTGEGQVSASLMFSGAVSFNSSVAGFFTSAVNNCTEMFVGCSSFNQDLAGVKLSTPLIADGMFKDCITFNKPVGNLNGVDLIGVVGMFEGCRSFNQNLMGLKFKTSNLNSLLAGCSTFNQPLNDLDVSNVTSTDYLFDGCTAFTSDLSAWDVSSLKSATAMLRNTSNFDSDLNWWCVSNITTEPENFATGSFLARSNYPKWGTCPIRDVVVTINGLAGPVRLNDVRQLTYKLTQDTPVQSTVWTSSNESIAVIDDSGNAVFTGLGSVTITLVVNGLYTGMKTVTVQDVIQPMTVMTTGVNGGEVMIATNGVMVDWGDGSDPVLITSNNSPVTHTYTDSLKHLIRITPTNADLMPSIVISGEIEEVVNWYTGLNQNISLSGKLQRVPNVAPNTTSFVGLFSGCVLFNQDISGWDTSNVKNMTKTFKGATKFNQPLNSWDVSNVITMGSMFTGASAFNRPLDLWDVSNVTDMNFMFMDALLMMCLRAPLAAMFL
jgi:surface protein